MSWHVTIARKAAREIEEQYHWLAKRSKALADRWRNSLLEAISTLEDDPQRCPEAPEAEWHEGYANSSTANTGRSTASFSRSAGRPWSSCAYGTAPRISWAQSSSDLVRGAARTSGLKHFWPATTNATHHQLPYRLVMLAACWRSSSQEATSWSLLGSLLASWYRHNESLQEDFVAHSMDARALGDAMAALGTATGSADLDGWNDADGRSVSDVLAAIDAALETPPD